MLYTVNIKTDLKIESLKDLAKLQPFLENKKLKINATQIAKELGVDRRTVKKYISGFEKSKTRNKTSYLDGYYEIIEELLSDSNLQVFYYKSILYQYLVDNHKLNCAESSFRRYISNHDEFQSYFDSRRKKNISNSTHIRFETPPGKQAQLDWKESIPFTLKSGEIVSLNILVLLLSYSRYRIYHLSLSKSQDILFDLLNQSFELMDGVPNEILTDNMKTVMDTARTEYNKGKVNAKFKQFADDYGFKVKPCIAGRPQTKAKVEAPMKILDEIRAYNGKLDYPELHQLVSKINDRANYKVNRGTGKIPIMYFEKEKASLSPLPKEQIRKHYTIIKTSVKVNPSSMITYQSNQYSVPPEYIGKTLALQVHDNQLNIYYNTSLVVVHSISNKKLNYLDKHYIEIATKSSYFKDEDILIRAKENLNAIGELYQNE